MSTRTDGPLIVPLRCIILVKVESEEAEKSVTVKKMLLIVEEAGLLMQLIRPGVT